MVGWSMSAKRNDEHTHKCDDWTEEYLVWKQEMVVKPKVIYVSYLFILGHPSILLLHQKRVLSASNSPLKFCQNFDQKRNSSDFRLLCGHFSTNMQVSYHFGKLRPSPPWCWSPFEWKVNDQWEISSWK